MLIRELTETACKEVLERARFGRLACCLAGQPYIVPLSLVFRGGYFYGFSAHGLKIDWMRLNPLVCVEIDEIARDSDWKSVVVLGRFQELPNVPEWEAERLLAWTLMQRTPEWWNPGSIKLAGAEDNDGVKPIWFRIEPGTITGRGASDSIISST